MTRIPKIEGVQSEICVVQDPFRDMTVVVKDCHAQGSGGLLGQGGGAFHCSRNRTARWFQSQQEPGGLELIDMIWYNMANAHTHTKKNTRAFKWQLLFQRHSRRIHIRSRKVVARTEFTMLENQRNVTNLKVLIKTTTYSQDFEVNKYWLSYDPYPNQRWRTLRSFIERVANGLRLRDVSHFKADSSGCNRHQAYGNWCHGGFSAAHGESGVEAAAGRWLVS